MLDYYFGRELYIVSMVMLAIVGINLILLFFIPFARRTFGYALLLLGLALVLSTARYQYQLGFFGSRSEGKIVDLVEVTSLSNNPNEQFSTNTITYRPVVNFTTADGRPVQFRAGQDVNEGIYTVGQTVAVRYMAGHPGFAEIDSWLSLWRPMLFASLFDWIVCIGGVVLILKFGLPRRSD